MKQPQPTQGDIVTTKDGKQWRVLEIEGKDLFRGVEYRENDHVYFPSIKMLLIKNIE
jgi:hypothetical protein